MPIGVLTKSRTKTFPKNGATLGGIHIDVSIIDEITEVEADVDNANVTKTKELTRIDEVHKIVELTATPIDDAGAKGAISVVEEVTISLVDEVLDTSIADTWSWEVAGED